MVFVRPARARSRFVQKDGRILPFQHGGPRLLGEPFAQRRLQFDAELVAQLIAAAVGELGNAHGQIVVYFRLGPQDGQNLLADRGGKQFQVGGQFDLLLQLHLARGHLDQADGRLALRREKLVLLNEDIEQVVGSGELAQGNRAARHRPDW